MGIEPTLSAWEADALPLSYTRLSFIILMQRPGFVKRKIAPSFDVLVGVTMMCDKPPWRRREITGVSRRSTGWTDES